MKTKKRNIDKPHPNAVELDLDLVYNLAKIHCTNPEIASACDCSVDTIERRCAGIIAKGREDGKQSLRRVQYLAAEKGNVQMMIWLGKQLLGQRDRFAEETAPVQYSVVVNQIPC